MMTTFESRPSFGATPAMNPKRTNGSWTTVVWRCGRVQPGWPSGLAPRTWSDVTMCSYPRSCIAWTTSRMLLTSVAISVCGRTAPICIDRSSLADGAEAHEGRALAGVVENDLDGLADLDAL